METIVTLEKSKIAKLIEEIINLLIAKAYVFYR